MTARLTMVLQAVIVPLVLAYFSGLLTLSTATGHSDLEGAPSPPYYPAPIGGRLSTNQDWDSAYEQARQFVADLSLLEKVNLTTGVGWMQGFCVGNTGDIPRVGFRGLCLQDGPLGVRMTDYNTAFPPAISVGASFNKDLFYLRGKAVALEHREKGVDIMLGPSTGPLGAKAAGGRNWEGFGSDPYLQGIAGGLTVQGIQDQGIMATAKHWVANEQEYFRQQGEWSRDHGFTNLKEPLSSNVGDRALHEVYGWPFADMVKANVGSVMCSYQQLNGSNACQNSYLLNGVLKDELGFEGFVMSDWGAQRSGAASVLAGLDMNMPGDSHIMGDGASYMGGNLTAAILNGTIPASRVDDMATRIMAAYYLVGLDETRKTHDGANFYSWGLEDVDLIYNGAGEGPRGVVNHHVNVQTDLSRSTAHQVALEAISLLKNDGSLPLKASTVRRIGILGQAAGPSPDGPNCQSDMACDSGPFVSGWGSGAVRFPFLITPLDAVNARGIAEGISVDWNLDSHVTDTFVDVASTSDVNVIFAGANAGEGFVTVDGNLGDRKNYSLWYNADEQIKAAAKLNSNNVVVISSVGPVNVEQWIDHPNVTAVLFTTPGGEYAGRAVEEVLFGDHNPSGRLPFTIAKDDSEYWQLVTEVPNNGLPQDNFDDGIYVDYRLFEKRGVEPRFAFGVGGSYSTWDISGVSIKEVQVPSEHLPEPVPLKKAPADKQYDLEPAQHVYPDGFERVNKFEYPYLASAELAQPSGEYPYPEGYSEVQREEHFSNAAGGPGGNPALWQTAYTITTQVTNTGSVEGAFVVQLYLEYPDSEEYPTPRQLRGFEKVFLLPGHSSEIDLNLLWRDLAVWDVYTQSWVVQRGEYKVHLGTSSRDFVQTGTITIA